MELFGLGTTFLIAIFGGITLSGILALVIYFVILKPRIEQPLPNETPLGFWTISLPHGIGVLTGNATTAERTIQKLFTEIIANETVEATRKKLIKTRDTFNNYYPIAQKVGRETYIHLFDVNPQDPKFLDMDPDHDNSYIIGRGVQDALTMGNWDGWNLIGVKLDPETKQFSDEHREQLEVNLQILKYLRNVAKDASRVRDLKEDRDYYQGKFHDQTKETAKQRSRGDRAESALGQKSLTVSEEVKVPGAWRGKAKEWFWSTPWQVVGAIAGYLLAPYLQTSLNLPLTPPTTTYFAVFIGAIGFFAIPIGKKLLGRWL